MPDCILDLSSNEPVEYSAADSLLSFSVVITDQILSGADDIVVKSSYSLQNYPNPFNPQTTITFFTAENAENAELVIYNIKGQKVKTLIHEALPAGKHSVVWNGKNSNGKRVSSGVYFYKLEMKKGKPLIKKMLLLK
jgi:flagellar hook assembly protein FlgD